MPLTVLTTADHSHTLYNSELDETYHSRNGAVEESEYVFLKQGLEFASGSRKTLSLLEIGFGTGLNAILTLKRCRELNITCRYHALETLPLPVETVKQLNYAQFIPASLHDTFLRLHACSWNEEVQVTDGFSISKIRKSVHSYQARAAYDLVYFDAFGPDKQPDMWATAVFENLYRWMSPGAVLVTYSAKGDVRRALAQAGFKVERLPGPPRKRHMTRAIKP